ncbi:hypothetical protein CBM2592_B100207 [Cupriavidus taiwanensis]|nr:hypothetical protein CBM2588_B100056 [Cupriavidus taiwanensis]SOY61499.1 hypothetical protein CBM2592_B100207 [Cupriavidus taiwanensis]SOY97992.1 hypothetical protein CBM2591_B80207 [Cupriavidus taiwanensis]SOZ68314.1 hypothetical protein CBM2617_B120016 [Cupriavidus taiwanensis]SOZ84913.1 hypothetical protein CBM2618_B120016 [Cupriavidus taiwanensis]
MGLHRHSKYSGRTARVGSLLSLTASRLNMLIVKILGSGFNDDYGQENNRQQKKTDRHHASPLWSRHRLWVIQRPIGP